MLEIRLAGAQIGADICGLDVKTMDDATFGAIYRAWLDYNVVAVRGQDLDIEDYLAYSRRFGEVVTHPSKNTRHPDHPEITVLGTDKFDAEGKLKMSVYKRGGEGFHTDGSYEKVPFKATQLYAIAIPSTGGDTLFASTYAAYDALPEKLKARIKGLNGVYVFGGATELAIDLLNKTAVSLRSCTHWCAPIRRPGARFFTSTPTSCCASMAFPLQKARR